MAKNPYWPKIVAAAITLQCDSRISLSANGYIGDLLRPDTCPEMAHDAVQMLSRYVPEIRTMLAA